MKAKVYINQRSLAGYLWEDEEGFHFLYELNYIDAPVGGPVSLTLPVRREAYHSDVLFPFFDGLIPEGWLLQIVEKNWKLNPGNRMELLLATGRNCIGNVSVIGYE